MAAQNSNGTGFRINRDVPSYAGVDEGSASQFPAFAGPNLVFAIPRDPRTLFIYWNIDWGRAFAAGPPKDRRVYVRVAEVEGENESELEVEPLLGSFYAPVTQPRGTYRAELGYYTPDNQWCAVGASDAITAPPDGAADSTAVDVATVPFHLSFQKLVDLFSGSSDDPLAVAISRAQARARQGNGTDLTAEEHEVLQAMDLSLAELRADREIFAESADQSVLRKRAEAILGFGATSPTNGFGDSSSPGSGRGGSGRN